MERHHYSWQCMKIQQKAVVKLSKRIAYCFGAVLDDLILSSTGKQSTVLPISLFKAILVINRSAAFNPKPYGFIAIVVKAGSSLSTKGMSLKPTTETSSGQFNPFAFKASIAPIA